MSYLYDYKVKIKKTIMSISAINKIMTAKTPEELDSLISSNSNIPIFDYRVYSSNFAGLIGFLLF